MSSLSTATTIDQTSAAVLLKATTRPDLQARVIGLLPQPAILDLLAGGSDLPAGLPDMLVEAFLDRLEDAVQPTVPAVPETASEHMAEEVLDTVPTTSPGITETVPVDAVVQKSADPETPNSPRYSAQAAAHRIGQSVGPRPQSMADRREWCRRLERETADELRKLRAVYGPDPRSTDTRFRQLCVSIESQTRGKIDRAAIKALADAAPVSSP
ncbi:MAG: hypothetical protein ACLGJC_18405 [Alphaproteobacteria bacterium]